MTAGPDPAAGALRGPWAGLSGEELAVRWGVDQVESWTRIGSTNDRAAEWGRALGAAPAGPVVVIAEEQTAGRGRRGARWRSRPGAGIWMSLRLPPGPSDAALPLVVGVAAAEAIEKVAGGDPVVEVKWPNDLLVRGRKVGGVLCESGAGGVVIGLGLDVTADSVAGESGLDDIATALEVEHGKTLSRIELADAIVVDVLAAVAGAQPFAAVRDALDRRDALRGRPIVSETHGPGIGAGIDTDGALLLDGDGGRQRVVSGRVRLAPDSARA